MEGNTQNPMPAEQNAGNSAPMGQSAENSMPAGQKKSGGKMLVKNKKVQIIGLALAFLVILLVFIYNSGAEDVGSELPVTGNVVVELPENLANESPSMNDTVQGNETNQNQTDEFKIDPWIPDYESCKAIHKSKNYSDPRFKDCLEMESRFDRGRGKQKSSGSSSGGGPTCYPQGVVNDSLYAGLPHCSD